MFWDLITDYGNKIIYSKTYYLANSFHTNILGSRAAGIGLTGNGIPDTTGPLLIGTDTIRKIVVIGTQLTGTIVAHPGTTRSLGNAERDAVVGRDDTAMLLGSSVGKGDGRWDDNLRCNSADKKDHSRVEEECGEELHSVLYY